MQVFAGVLGRSGLVVEEPALHVYGVEGSSVLKTSMSSNIWTAFRDIQTRPSAAEEERTCAFSSLTVSEGGEDL